MLSVVCTWLSKTVTYVCACPWLSYLASCQEHRDTIICVSCSHCPDCHFFLYQHPCWMWIPRALFQESMWSSWWRMLSVSVRNFMYLHSCTLCVMACAGKHAHVDDAVKAHSCADESLHGIKFPEQNTIVSKTNCRMSRPENLCQLLPISSWQRPLDWNVLQLSLINSCALLRKFDTSDAHVARFFTPEAIKVMYVYLLHWHQEPEYLKGINMCGY